MARKTKRKNTNAKRIKRLERITRPEVKYNFTESGFTSVGAVTGTLIQPQKLQEGYGRANRVGDKVKSRNVRFQAIIKLPDGATNSTCAVRILALRSKMQHPSTSHMPNWYSTVDMDKFFVLKDILTQVSTRTLDPGVAYKGSTLRKIKFNLPTGYRKLQYDGAGYQSPLNNEYVIYLLAENGSAEVAYNWQHYYIDN